MKYTILEIMNAFAELNSLNEIELSILFKNINFLKENDNYKKLLEEINFDKNGISSELIGEIATAIINKDIVLDNKLLVFTMNQDLRKSIRNSVDTDICLAFMNDFISLTNIEEKNKEL